MLSDERVHTAVEQMLRELRSPLEAGLRTFADGLDRQADSAREAAVREAADIATAEARRRAQADLEEARRTAQAQLEDAERALGDRLAALQRDLDDARRGAEEHRRTMQAGREASDALRAQLDAARTEIASLQAQAARHAAAVREWRTLLDGVRSLDEASALGDVLERVLAVHRTEDERRAVYVLKGDRLQRWRAAGFAATGSSHEREPARRESTDISEEAGGAEVRIVDAGVVADAVRSGRSEVRGANGPPSSFPSGSAGRLAVASPILVGGAVVAVLYGDAPRGDAGGDERWPAMYELLARHASRVLEAIAIQRAAGLLPHGGLLAGSTAPRVGGSA